MDGTNQKMWKLTNKDTNNLILKIFWNEMSNKERKRGRMQRTRNNSDLNSKKKKKYGEVAWTSGAWKELISRKALVLDSQVVSLIEDTQLVIAIQ